MQKSSIKALLLGLAISISGCATSEDPTQKPPGFLPDYTLLKQVDAPDGMQMYTYKNPTVSRSDYDAGIVDPVTIYQGATSESAVTSEQIENARAGIDKGIKQIVKKKVQVVTKAGPGVFRLHVAITGATLEKDSLKPWNLVPVSLALHMAQKATGLDNKKPILVVELKITDSRTGNLLKETVTTISGEKFRMESNTSSEFENLATEWVKQALEYSGKN